MIKFLTSLKLTVVTLAFSILIVFIGTVAQADEGLYYAQDKYFKQWIVPNFTMFGHYVPIPLPGGYLLGTVLLVNLVAAHIKRFQFTWKKSGIHLTHAGIILMLVGQLTTDLFSIESHLRLKEGETKNYSEGHRENELVFLTDTKDGENDKVIAVAESWVAQEKEIRHPDLPFVATIERYDVNSRLSQRGPMVDKDPPPATEGIGPRVKIESLPETRKMDDRNFPTAVIKLVSTKDNKELGTWLLSTWLVEPETVTVDGQDWRMAFRWKRYYTPFSVHLLKTTHEKYAGTEIPRNFQSRVRIENPGSGENREVDIYMNHPLRYAGLTYFQYQMGRDEANQNIGTTTLQVVRNPSWLTPYLACILVGIGLVVQFMIHLIGFTRKQKST